MPGGGTSPEGFSLIQVLAATVVVGVVVVAGAVVVVVSARLVETLSLVGVESFPTVVVVAPPELHPEKTRTRRQQPKDARIGNRRNAPPESQVPRNF